MSWTMIRFVNMAMKELGLVGGEQNELLSFHDSARQRAVDIIIQKTNETIHELYTTSTSPLPTETRERDIVLLKDIREYLLPDNLAQIRWPLINSRDGMRIDPYRGGYERMRVDQLQSDKFKGTPVGACIHPSTGKLYLDSHPLAADAGRRYTLFYDRTLVMEDEGDILPFNDPAAFAIVSAVVERYRGSQRGGMDEGVYWASMARAMENAGMKIRRRRW